MVIVGLSLQITENPAFYGLNEKGCLLAPIMEAPRARVAAGMAGFRTLRFFFSSVSWPLTCSFHAILSHTVSPLGSLHGRIGPLFLLIFHEKEQASPEAATKIV